MNSSRFLIFAIILIICHNFVTAIDKEIESGLVRKNNFVSNQCNAIVAKKQQYCITETCKKYDCYSGKQHSDETLCQVFWDNACCLLGVVKQLMMTINWHWTIIIKARTRKPELQM